MVCWLLFAVTYVVPGTCYIYQEFGFRLTVFIASLRNKVQCQAPDKHSMAAIIIFENDPMDTVISFAVNHAAL